MIERRAFLGGALAGCAGLALGFPRGARAASPTVTPLTRELALVSGAGGNVLVRAGRDGQALVDTGAADARDALLAALAELPGAGRVQIVFNTHWHPEQVGSNVAFGRAGARIVAHAKTAARLAARYYLREEDRYRNPLPEEGRPTETFYDRGETVVDGERVEYGYLLEAHTDGDIYVFFRDSNVMAVGDAVSPARDPVLDWFGGGWLGGRVDSLARVLEISDDDTRFVPAYGPAVGRAAVQAEHDLMLEIFERMVEHVRKGESAAVMLAEGLLDGLPRTFDDPFAFVYAAHKGFWAHHNTLSPDVV
ncbi:MAG TPA: MBL fold metallo-hydrolase [Gammaproteobacteria bacterium]